MLREQRQPRSVIGWHQTTGRSHFAMAGEVAPSLAMGFFGWAVCAVIGCGAQSDRLAVSGEVTLDGAPLDGGSIRFSSAGSEKVISTGAMIKNGRYRIPREQGLTPGTYYLVINAPDRDAPPVMVRNTPGGPGIPTARDRIPPEYNINSQKTIEITSAGDNHFVFDIVSRPAE